MSRGCTSVSMCSLCNAASESSNNLFLACPFALHIWTRLKRTIGCDIDLSSFNSVLQVCDRGWSSQIRDLVLAAIINVFWEVWCCRNQLRFQNKSIPLNLAIDNVIASVSLAGSLSKGHMSSSIDEFSILKFFSVYGHVNCAPAIKEVIWSPPPCHWVKCNTDGAARGALGWSACGGIFRDYRGSVLGCFAANLGVSCSLQAELFGVLAIENAVVKGWKNLWLECDSQLVVAAFKSSYIVPWKLRNRWFNCLDSIRSMRFYVSHIYREGNTCADRLANHGLSIYTGIFVVGFDSCFR